MDVAKPAAKRAIRKKWILWITLLCFVITALGWTAIYVSQAAEVAPVVAMGHRLYVCRECGVTRLDRSLQVLDWTSKRTALKPTLTSKLLGGKRSSTCKHNALVFVYLQRKAIRFPQGYSSSVLGGNLTNHNFLNDESFVRELQKAADAQKLFRAESFTRLPYPTSTVW